LANGVAFTITSCAPAQFEILGLWNGL